jgi:hypothetical protein
MTPITYSWVLSMTLGRGLSWGPEISSKTYPQSLKRPRPQLTVVFCFLLLLHASLHSQYTATREGKGHSRKSISRVPCTDSGFCFLGLQKSPRAATHPVWIRRSGSAQRCSGSPQTPASTRWCCVLKVLSLVNQITHSVVLNTLSMHEASERAACAGYTSFLVAERDNLGTSSYCCCPVALYFPPPGPHMLLSTHCLWQHC